MVPDLSELPSVVYQAQVMVSAQAGYAMDDALALMRNTADAAEVSLEQLAMNVVDRTVSFDLPS